MVTINSILVELLGNNPPKVKILSRNGPNFYKTLDWPAGEPLTEETIKIEVAKQWNVDSNQVTILDNVEIPKT